MTEKEQIENLANDVYIFYRNLGSAQRKHLTKSQIFRNFNLNNSNSSGVFKRSEELGVVFAINVPKMKQNEVFENPLFKEVITNNLPMIDFQKKWLLLKKNQQ